MIKEYETEEHEIVEVATSIEKLIAQGISPQQISLVWSKGYLLNDIKRYIEGYNIPWYSRMKENILDSPFIKKIINIVRYLSMEQMMTYSGDHILFEILHYDFFEIPHFEIDKLAIELNRHKQKGEATSMRKLLHDKLNTPVLTLFDPDLPGQLTNIIKTIETLLAEISFIPLQAVLNKVIDDTGIRSYISTSKTGATTLVLLNRFYELIEDESNRNPYITLQQFVDLITEMHRNEIPVTAEFVSGIETGVRLLSLEEIHGLVFEHVFVVGCNATISKEERRAFEDALSGANFLHASCHRLQPLLSESVAELSSSRLGFTGPPTDKATKDLISRLVENFTMSVSALSNYLHCPREFYYKNIIRSPSAKSEALVFGSSVHFAIQRLFEKMRLHPSSQFPPSSELIEDFLYCLNIEGKGLTPEAFEKRKEYGCKVLLSYYDSYVNSWNKIVAIERNIANVSVKGVPLRGKLDKLEFDGKEVNIVDYKSGSYQKALNKFKAPDDSQPHGGDYWRQAVFYKILIDNYHEKSWKVVRIEFDFIEPDGNNQYYKHQMIIRAQDVETVTHQIIESWQKIQSHDFYNGCDRRNCHWCNMSTGL